MARTRNTTSARLTNADIYAKVTARVTDALAQGVIPWEKPWHGGGNRLPCNALSLREYSGVNVWALFWESIDRGYQSRGWVTFKQAISHGCVPVKGQKGTPVFYMAKLQKKATATQAAEGKDGDKFFVARLYYVFNLDQLKDLDGKEGSVQKLRNLADGETRAEGFERDAQAEWIVAQTGAVIRHGGSQAYYDPKTDHVQMPDGANFTRGAAGYYPTLFHELGHWTGAKSRLDRNMIGKFENKVEYALEELVAELTAAFLSARLGYDHVSQGAAYIHSWLKVCQEHDGAFVAAARAAQAAADFIWGEQGDTEESAEEMELATA